MSLNYEEKLRRSELVAAAALMVEIEGCSTSHAARTFGVSPSAVWKRVNGFKDTTRDNARKRRWEREHRGICTVCGGPLGVGSARGDGTNSEKHGGHCRSCLEGAAEKLIAELWREGMTSSEIAEAMGWTARSITATISRLRAQGVDLPYRRSRESVELMRQASHRRWGIAA